MSAKTFSYPALKIRQSPEAPPVIFFAAPCIEMAEWAGIPQKKKFGASPDQETVGFQRQEAKSRVNDLKQFYSDPSNVIQNPLLCAARQMGPEGVTFTASGDEGSGALVTNGVLSIAVPDFNSFGMTILLELVRTQLEKRVPELKGMTPSSSLIERLKRGLRTHQSPEDSGNTEHNDEINGEEDSLDSDSPDSTVALFEESHITDFWAEVSARHAIARELAPDEVPDPFLGFSRDLLVSYLQPTVVVDGQHRLRGALAHAHEEINSDVYRVEGERLIDEGGDPSAIRNQLLKKVSKVLPISLLLSDDPAEQVFQFVVVNQKATPIGKALLGTIVSTSLGQHELEKVAGRLKRAGIPLEESRAISLVVRSRNSPFFGKVQRGIDSNNNELLEWNILGQLISIFKNLEGGRLYGESNDYADLWRRRFLDHSGIIGGFESKNFDSPMSYWSSTDGPWLEVFVAFWNAVKKSLASEDPQEANYWGNPRTSNLFNKVSLSILSADFFVFLTDKDRTIGSVEEVETLVEDWLTGVQVTYFKRDWEMSGVKKDTTGIKKRWAAMWREYRKNPIRLPNKSNYRLALN